MEHPITKQIIEYLESTFTQSLQGNPEFKVRPEVLWGKSSSRIRFDLLVTKYDIPFAIFDIRSKFHDDMARIIATRFFVELPIEYYVFYIYENQDFTKNYFIVIQKNQYDKNKKYKLNEIINLFINNQKTFESNVIDSELKFYEKNEKILDPEWSRGELGMVEYKEICRYCTLDSLFSTIKFKTFRMNGLPGMNDKGEGLFAWNLIYSSNDAENEEIKRRKRAINDTFILSFSTHRKIDDLTQWRLYGDDAKGVCCIFSIEKDKVKNRFFLHDIKYINTSSEEDEDPLLKKIKEYSSKRGALNYSDLSPVIFFYKPDSYKSEEEVRLLVDNKNTSAYKTNIYKREWVLTNSNEIPNPYIDIAFNNFPLKLTKILLGPNMKDVDTIQAQLETLLEQQGIEAVVELSNITSYRNSNK